LVTGERQEDRLQIEQVVAGVFGKKNAWYLQHVIVDDVQRPEILYDVPCSRDSWIYFPCGKYMRRLGLRVRFRLVNAMYFSMRSDIHHLSHPTTCQSKKREILRISGRDA
jgi:hypothetical protein